MSHFRTVAIVSLLLALAGVTVSPVWPVAADAPLAATRLADLGTLGGNYSDAFAINAAGQVVGESTTTSGDRHAFLWTPGSGMRDLGTLGGSYSIAKDINGRGQVVGWSTTANGQHHAFIWTPEGGLRDLGTLGRQRSYANGINDRGQVIGYTAALDQDPPYTRIGHAAFIWTAADGMRDLRAPDDQWSEAWSINSSGQVAGSRSGRAFRWTANEGMQDLGVPAGRARSFVTAINNRGQIVGWSEGQPRNGPQHVYIWTAALGPRDLVTMPDGVGTAQDIDESGRLIAQTSGGLVSWTEQHGLQPITLASLGGSAQYVTAMNDRGQLVGYSSTASGDQHATLWILGE